jgi:hypothetical protein
VRQRSYSTRGEASSWGYCGVCHAGHLLVSWALLLLFGCAATGPLAPTSPCAGGAESRNGAAADAVSACVPPNALDVPGAFVDIATPSGKQVRIPVERDEYVRADAGFDVQVLAEVGSSLAVIDTYLSRPGGASYCQAGEERFLRILRLDDAGPQVTLRLKLASCWQDIELTDAGVEWSPADSTLRVHWLFGPTSKRQPEELILRLGREQGAGSPSNDGR